MVAVPRFAKSAGTLIALGADEIHMGIISELGPIDPQMGDYPALGLGSAVEHIANLCKKHPDAVEMLAKYLASSLNLHDLGYFERVSASAVQYAERLLSGRPLPAGLTPASIAQRFVYGYKDHGFVIDRDEATEILGAEIVKSDTSEYKLANRIHEYLDTVNLAYSVFKNHGCKILGDLNRASQPRKIASCHGTHVSGVPLLPLDLEANSVDLPKLSPQKQGFPAIQSRRPDEWRRIFV